MREYLTPQKTEEPRHNCLGWDSEWSNAAVGTTWRCTKCDQHWLAIVNRNALIYTVSRWKRISARKAHRLSQRITRKSNGW